MINIMLIFLVHWFADFVCQSHNMATKKSTSIKWLSWHILLYTVITTLLWGIFFGGNVTADIGFAIFGVTFATHWVTDFFTSKWTSRLWAKQDVHNFFVVIGFDQLIHATTLLLTYNYLIKTIVC